MSEWPEELLADLVYFQEGPGLRNWQWVDRGMKVINGKNILPSGELDPTNTDRCISSEEFEKRYRHFAISAGDIVVSSSGTLGKVAIVQDRHLPMMMNTSVIRFRPLDSRLDSDFLFAFLRSPEFQKQARALATGAAQMNFGPLHVNQMKIRRPPASVQRSIGLVLRSFDDLIENDRRRVELLEQMARAIYREWFVKFRYPGHQDVPLADSALGPIPEGWGVEPFDDIASFVNGFAFKPSHWGADGRPIIKIKELKAGVTATTPRCPEDSIDSRYWVEAGDVLMSWSADLGVYLWGDEPGLLNQHVFVVRPANDAVPLLYLLHALGEAMPEFRARAQGTTMKHIKRAALHEVAALLPPRMLVSHFDDAVEPIHRESMTLQTRARELSAMRDLLLPKLVTGQIDVSSLDLDALLEGQVA